MLAVLFGLAMVAAPVLDSWLHANDDTAAATQHSGAGDCVICRLAATPLTPSAGAETAVTGAVAVESLGRVAEEARLPAAPPRLRPPTRAPPA